MPSLTNIKIGRLELCARRWSELNGTYALGLCGVCEYISDYLGRMRMLGFRRRQDKGIVGSWWTEIARLYLRRWKRRFWYRVSLRTCMWQYRWLRTPTSTSLSILHWISLTCCDDTVNDHRGGGHCEVVLVYWAPSVILSTGSPSEDDDRSSDSLPSSLALPFSLECLSVSLPSKWLAAS